MHHHRFRDQPGFAPSSTVTAPAAAADSFLVCPVVLLQGWMGQPCPWQAVYQVAFERARAVLSPSQLERLERAILWN
jgi:hypothetical protein